MKFITLKRGEPGNELRINVAHIQFYMRNDTEKTGSTTIFVEGSKEPWYCLETPEEIDALIGL